MFHFAISARNLGAHICVSLLNRCVLRPSRHAIDAGDLIRCEHPIQFGKRGFSTTIESYVATNLDFESLPFAMQSTTLGRDWANVPPPRTLILKFPGTGGRAERSTAFPASWIPFHQSAASSQPGQHYEVWTWNPPGYGGSEGRADLGSMVPAAQAFASQTLAARVARSADGEAGPHTRVWLCGNSLGCLSALSLAAGLGEWLPDGMSTDGFGIWLRNPPDLAEVVLRVADRYYSRFFMRHVVARLPDSLDVFKSARQCELPAVFLMSELDTLVPPDLQRQIHAAYAGEHYLVTLTDLDHAGVIDEQHRGDIERAVSWHLHFRSTKPC